MKNMKVRRRGSELLPSCPRQLLGITFPIQLRCPTPSLLEAWNQPLAFSPLANSLGAHTQPPPAFLALPLLTQIGLQAEPAVPLRTLPQPRSLTLRARPLPAGSTAWRCQAKLNCLEPGNRLILGKGVSFLHFPTGISDPSRFHTTWALPQRLWSQKHLPSSYSLASCLLAAPASYLTSQSHLPLCKRRLLGCF